MGESAGAVSARLLRPTATVRRKEVRGTAVFRRKSRDGSPSKYFSYDFWVAVARYRGVIREARTKAQAGRAEIKIRDSVYEGKYGKTDEAPTPAEFVEET